MGGLNICAPKQLAKEEYANSHTATQPLVCAVSEQMRGVMVECTDEVMKIRNGLNSMKRKHVQDNTETIRDHASDNMKLAMDLTKEKSASSWLGVLPIAEFGFFLHKEHSRTLLLCDMGGTYPISRKRVCGKSHSRACLHLPHWWNADVATQ